MNEPVAKNVEYMNPTDLYFMFISIVFGVFIAVWIEPITTFFPKLYIAEMTNEQLRESFIQLKNVLLQQKMLVGAIMFLILVCLWWWYGTFLGKIRPAIGFWLYLYDFVTLCSFAVAFRFWPHPIVFPIIVVIAAALMLGRFGGALFLMEGPDEQKHARMALIVAIVVLSAYVVFGVGVLAMPYFQSDSTDDHFESIIKTWYIFERIVIVLLLFGILATIAAVVITEGWPFRMPRDRAEW